jgi:hypothetical protein
MTKMIVEINLLKFNRKKSSSRNSSVTQLNALKPQANDLVNKDNSSK